jgi:hypothetical protein
VPHEAPDAPAEPGAAGEALVRALFALTREERYGLTVEGHRRLLNAEVATRLRARVGAAFATLAPEERRVLEMREVEHLGYRTIAEMTGWSVAEVEARLLRARWRLRRTFEAQCVPASSEANCAWVLARMSAAVDGELSPAKQAGVWQHVAVCERCRNVLRDLQAASQLFGLTVGNVEEQAEALAGAGAMTMLEMAEDVEEVPAVEPPTATAAESASLPIAAEPAVAAVVQPPRRHLGRLAARAGLVAVTLGGLLWAATWLADRTYRPALAVSAGVVTSPSADGPRVDAPPVAVAADGAAGTAGREAPAESVETGVAPTAAVAPAASGAPALSPRSAPSPMAEPIPTLAIVPLPGVVPSPAASPASPSATALVTASPTRPEPTAAAPRFAVGDWVVVQADAASPAWSFSPSDTLNLRAHASARATLLGSVRPGTVLTLLGGPVDTTDAEFYPVRLPNGTEGWVAPARGDVPTRVYLEWAVQRPLHAGPGLDPTGRTVHVGTLVQVLDLERAPGGSSWAHVRAGTATGYLPAESLAAVGVVP